MPKIRRVYADYAATTPVDPRVAQAMEPYWNRVYGNPSSLNAYGLEAKKALEDSRNIIANAMKGEPDQLVFTGSATEANNLALKGHAFNIGKSKCHIAVSTIDHDCVLNTAKWLKEQGYKVSKIPVDQYGLVKIDALEEILQHDVSLVSMVHGNNEIGTIQQLEKIIPMCHKYNALFHTDAVQSFGKFPINVDQLKIDLMTINAHKLYGPKGIGALYIRKGTRLSPLIHGGSQEFGLRAGTHNIPGIVGFAKAVEIREKEMTAETQRLTQLRDKLIKRVLEIEDAYLNGHPTKRLSNNASFRFSYIEGEAVILDLDTKGIAASTGSACASLSGEPSHVLLAIGLKPEEARGSLRLSLGKYNTEEDIQYITEILPKVVERIRKMSPINRRTIQNTQTT